MKKLFYEVKKESKNIFYKLYIHKIGPFRFNWHKEIEVNIILKGKVEVCVEGKKHILQEDDIIIINSNNGHATLCKEPDSMAMVFHLDPMYFKEYFEEEEYENLRFEGAVSIYNKNNKRYKIIRYLLASLIDELKKDSWESQIISDTIFSLVVANIIEAFPPSEDINGKTKNTKSQMEIISKVLNYIENMYKEKISLNTIADMLGYNPCYVSHFFKVNIGINFHEYLTRVRLREATFELAKTDCSISDVALSSGFSDVKSFNKSFKECFGRSPKQYRTEILKKNLFRKFPLMRVFVYDNDETVNSKLKEYRNLVQDNLLFIDKITSKKQKFVQEEQSIQKHQNKITELERNIEELNNKIELIKNILM
ncbi:AraC family transcriptional regulator [Clostridium sp. HV4-5-A1G]|uniref:AraC family transcriptional regulator n=1 Tax=Clostridium sp. HV4-5-A1G TaxID=2004595 RepID=UPI00123B860D|nr:AraC family transcriptional regulator [Clostridium sp. HV4-5-A1G]KAA8669679.1 AraC family transcriptional regulator [Clostridium sp. HV4-5-A1G]